MADKLLLKNLLNPCGVGSETNLRISGSCFNEASHSISNCIDICKGTSTGYSFYAPVTMKCLKVSTDGNNTAYFQSVNEVEFANGQTGILSMTFGHINTSIVSAGNTYVAGTKIYQEGTGGGVALHCHIRVGKGAFLTGYTTLNGCDPNAGIYANTKQYDILTENGPLTFSDAFYKDDMDVTYTDNAIMKKRYKWKNSNDGETKKIWLNATYGKFNIRQAPSTSSAIRSTVPIGGRARIVTFMSNFELDGYQWAFVDYNNGESYGYAQLDLKNNLIITRDVGAPELYLEAINSAFYVRAAVVSGGQMALISTGNKVKIISLPTTKESDGYQWAQVSYNGSSGFSQMDLQSAYNINFTNDNDSAI